MEEKYIELDRLGEELVTQIQEEEREKIFELIKDYYWHNVWIHLDPYDKTRWESFIEDHLIDYLKERLYG
jgi:predicted glycosyltransferase